MIHNHILAHLSSTDRNMAGVTSPMNWGEEIARLSPSLPVAMGLCEVDAEGSVLQPEGFEAFSQMAMEAMAQGTVELSLEQTSNDGVQLTSFSRLASASLRTLDQSQKTLICCPLRRRVSFTTSSAIPSRPLTSFSRSLVNTTALSRLSWERCSQSLLSPVRGRVQLMN